MSTRREETTIVVVFSMDMFNYPFTSLFQKYNTNCKYIFQNLQNRVLGEKKLELNSINCAATEFFKGFNGKSWLL